MTTLGPSRTAARQRLEALAGSRFTEALEVRPLADDALQYLAHPEAVRRFSLRTRMDSADAGIFTGWRVRYASVLGPTKGGVRFTPNVSEAELIGLAFRILLKCAVNGLPHGGAAGGVAVSPRDLSAAERERIARRYVDALGFEVSPDFDILSPDLGTDAETMGWMADQDRRTRGVRVAGAINGKPAVLGGIPGRPGATARGAWVVLREVLAARGWSPAGLTCAVQGYGSAGGRLATLLATHGLRVVAASDSSAGWHDPKGLDAQALWAAKTWGKRFVDLDVPGATRVSAEDVLLAPADIVIPAATANQIPLAMVSKLACKLILEIANGPVAPDADAALAARGIDVIPDLVANAGGITMSHFEWAQNRGGLLWTEADAAERLETRMRLTAHAMLVAAAAREVRLTVAAQILALDRLAAALVP